MIHGHKHHDIQRGIDILTATFARMGLQMNAKKTEALIQPGKKLTLKISDRAYTRMTNGGKGPSHQEHQVEKVGCKICRKVV
jgi:hypothetical protein